MDYRAIRNIIVKGMNQYLDAPVVPTDDTGDKPKYPYLSYKFINLYIPQNSHNIIIDVVPSLDAQFDYDIEYTKEEQPKMTISISSYSDDEVESYDLALRAREWFKFHGYQYLKDNNIVVNNIGNIHDRTVLIVDDYEKRQGLDVTIRVASIEKMIVPSMENISIDRRD